VCVFGRLTFPADSGAFPAPPRGGASSMTQAERFTPFAADLAVNSTDVSTRRSAPQLPLLRASSPGTRLAVLDATDPTAAPSVPVTPSPTVRTWADVARTPPGPGPHHPEKSSCSPFTPPRRPPLGSF
jgi:hypothetical protein